MATKKELQKALESIGYQIKTVQPFEYIYDFKNKCTGYRVLKDRIEFEGVSEHTAICFYYKGSKVEKIDHNAVSFGTEHCFALFMNHTIKPTD